MLFIEWWHVIRVSILLLVLVAAFLGFRSVLNLKAWPFRLPVQFICGVAMMCALGMALFGWAMPDPMSYSAPVYSPNGKMAARIADYNASGFGGADTSVELFSYHGLVSDVVFYGEWESVKYENLHWKNDSEFEVVYEGRLYRCSSTRHVIVRCIVQGKNTH